MADCEPVVEAGMLPSLVALLPQAQVDRVLQWGTLQDGKGWHAPYAGGSAPRPR